MKTQILNRSGVLLYESKKTGLSLRETAEEAVRARVDLSTADFRGADLSYAQLVDGLFLGADFRSANLHNVVFGNAVLDRADFSGANLSCAVLSHAIAIGTDFRGARLDGAALLYADFCNAHLAGAEIGVGYTLIGARPILQIGPIGSRADVLIAYLTDRGVLISTGCFFGTLDGFEDGIINRHYAGSRYKTEYYAATRMIRSHEALWTPTTEAEK